MLLELEMFWSSSTSLSGNNIPSTEQDGGIKVMSMGRNGSSLAWMTKFPPPIKVAELTLCLLWEEMGLVWPGVEF